MRRRTAVGLDAADKNIDARYRIIEVRDVRATLCREDEKAVIYVQCIVDEHLLSFSPRDRKMMITAEKDDYVWQKNRQREDERRGVKSARLLPWGIGFVARAGDLETRFKRFKCMYDIPGRWEMQIDEIYDALFRRLRQVFVDDAASFPEMLEDESRVGRRLDWLLSFMDEVKAQDSNTYASHWWLCDLVVKYLSGSQSIGAATCNPLLDEIKSWRGDGNRAEHDFIQQATNLKSRHQHAVALMQATLVSQPPSIGQDS